MWIFLSTLAILFGFCYLGALTIFFADDITNWLEAKTDYLRTKTEALKKQYELADECAGKEGTE